MTVPLLTIDNLCVDADAAGVQGTRARLLDGISLTLQGGEVLGLIGESGAGKSTLGLAAMGYARPGCHFSGGRVLFGGQDLLRLDRATLSTIRGARIAYIAQNPWASFNPSRRLGVQVAETLVLHRGASWADAERRAAALFAELDLPEPDTFGRRFAHQVSGGQLQRVMIAMAIACEPELLVLDEPTTALDVTTQIDVLAAIRKTLAAHRAAAIYISHDLALVAQLAHRVMVLRHGALVETGSTASIMTAPQHDYTRRLLAAHDIARTADAMPTPAGDGAALAAQGITASYRNHPGVLKSVSLSVKRGETLAIVGTSGSGKSTLARVICGLLPPDAGTVSFMGQALPPSLDDRSRDQLRRVQLIYQQAETALNPRQRVGRILGRAVALYSGGSRAEVQARVGELLRRVGLPPAFAGRLPSHLSGGEKQRVCIARALAAQPDVIVCDEIISSLDLLIADEILQLLQQIQRDTGTAYIFITHDIGVVRRIADTVAVLSHGELVAQGPLDQVFAPPLHPYTALLLSSVPEMRTGWLADVLDARARAGVTPGESSTDDSSGIPAAQAAQAAQPQRSHDLIAEERL